MGWLILVAVVCVAVYFRDEIAAWFADESAAIQSVLKPAV